MVPVLRDTDRKGLMTISKELKELADKARDFKLDIADMRGGTFTVTNVGALGGTMATPIINWPEVAILGMGKLEWKPVVRNGQVVRERFCRSSSPSIIASSMEPTAPGSFAPSWASWRAR